MPSAVLLNTGPASGEQQRAKAGLSTVEDFAHILLIGLDRDRLDQIHLDVHNVVETLGGRLLVEAKNRRLCDKVMVAAMDVKTMRHRVEPDIMMAMGDREDAQRATIEEGVCALVITSVMMGGVMSRKKQLVPILPRVARQRKASV
jgi:predicted transcriptional regulator